MKQQMITEVLTKEQLVRSLRELGVRNGMVLEVQSSRKSFGYVVGGAQTVVDALMDAVGYEGTIVMPLQSGDNTEPSCWCRPPIDRRLFHTIREHTPAFDPRMSDTRKMGRVVENFRRRQGVYFSYHPSSAFVAYGKYAKLICSEHSLHYSLSNESPLGQLWKLQAYVLLLGVDYTNCTGMHLGEYRSGVRPIVLQGGSVETESGQKWVEYLDLELDSDEFMEPGRRLERKGFVNTCTIGNATCKLFPLRPAVDQTVVYLQQKYGN